jgi:putative chitinase
MIDARLLIALGATPTAAKLHVEPLLAGAQRYAITTRERVAGWLGQIMVETGNLSTLEESLWYSTPARIAAVWPSRFRSPAEAEPFARNPQRLANRVYSNRNGNGSEASGDGWAYRGSGYLQHTGRANYQAEADATGLPFVSRPDLMRQPAEGAIAAASFWSRTGCHAPADAQDWDRVTRLVNGPAMLKAAERAAASRAALRALATA